MGEINLMDDLVPGPGGIRSEDLLLDDEPSPLDSGKPTMFDDLYDDLYYLDRVMELGLDMPRLAPDSVVKQPKLKDVKSWKG